MKTVVGVTGLKYIESPQAGFGIAKSLKKGGMKVIGIDDSPLVSAIASPDFDEVYVEKSLIKENREEFVKALDRIKKKTNLTILIPGFDREIFFFLAIKDQIENLGIKMLLPSIESLKMVSKPFLCNLHDEASGILVPETIRIRKKGDVKEAVKRLGFPVVCKGLLKDVYMAESLAEAEIYFRIVRERWGGGKGSVLFQKFVAGEPLCLSGVADAKSNLVNAVVMKKLGTDSKGSTWSGFSVVDKELIKIAGLIIKKTKWVGPFELEFLRTYNERKNYLFEINPRFPGWIYFATAIGQNQPLTVVKILRGMRDVSSLTYKHDKAFIRTASEQIIDLDLLKKMKRMATQR